MSAKKNMDKKAKIKKSRNEKQAELNTRREKNSEKQNANTQTFAETKKSQTIDNQQQSNYIFIIHPF